MTNRSPRLVRTIALGSAALIAAGGLAGCSSSSGGSGSGGSGGSGDVGVSLIVKTTTNPFFVAMEDGAKEAAAKDGIDLTLAAGKADGDEDTQIQAIENAISKGDKGILITINGPSVLDAIQKARDAGLFVIALDTAPDPADSVDITFATDNFARASPSASGRPRSSAARRRPSRSSTCTTTRPSRSTTTATRAS